MSEWVTIKTFMLEHQAGIPMSRLESEDIPCFLKDSNYVNIDNFMSAAIGGVKLQVREVDLEKANQLLFEWGYLQKEDLEPQPVPRTFKEFYRSLIFKDRQLNEIMMLIMISVILYAIYAITMTI